jgi:hypothetical protein
MVNGKKIELTEEQIKLLQEEPKKNICSRAKQGEKYYWINNYFTIVEDVERYLVSDGELHKLANYNTDKEFMMMKALEFKLSLLLTRLRDKHGDKPDWESKDYKRYIFYNHKYKKYEIYNHVQSNRDILQVYFKTYEIAEKALETFKTEFRQLATYYEKY